MIDDDLSILEELRKELESAGLQVHTAMGGEAGVETYRKHPGRMDLVIVDMVMPEYDGKHVVRNVFKDNPRARVIVMSGFSRDYARHYLNTGVWGFVQKPVDPDALMHAVARSLGGTRRRGGRDHA